MGLFSWNCKGCNKSIRHPGSTRAVSRWMSRAVFLENQDEHVNVMIGTYDGYGRLLREEGNVEVNRGKGEPCLYHLACWKAFEQPMLVVASKPSGDQGHFVGEYDPPEPKTKEDVGKIRKTRK